MQAGAMLYQYVVTSGGSLELPIGMPSYEAWNEGTLARIGEHFDVDAFRLIGSKSPEEKDALLREAISSLRGNSRAIAALRGGRA